MPARLGARAAAWLLDWLVVSVPVVMIILVVVLTEIGLDPGDQPSLDEIRDVTPAWVGLLPAAARALYDTVLVAVWGRTLGKLALRIRVVRNDGGRLDWWQAGIRGVIPQLASTVPLFGGGLVMAVYLASVFDPYRRGLHDRAAASLVVRNAPATGP